MEQSRFVRGRRTFLRCALATGLASPYVDAVARTHVRLALEDMRRRSPILAGLETKAAIQIVGAMYDLATGAVEFAL